LSNVGLFRSVQFFLFNITAEEGGCYVKTELFPTLEALL
jgi:hypothetical protein